jgi:hypothetical protein
VDQVTEHLPSTEVLSSNTSTAKKTKPKQKQFLKTLCDLAKKSLALLMSEQQFFDTLLFYFFLLLNKNVK